MRSNIKYKWENSESRRVVASRVGDCMGGCMTAERTTAVTLISCMKNKKQGKLWKSWNDTHTEDLSMTDITFDHVG